MIGRRTCLAALVAVACGGPAAAASSCPAALHRPATLRSIDRLFEGAIAAGKAPGYALAIACDGAIAYQRGYGLANLETRTPVAPRSVFRIGSITKQFTAAAILALQEDGKLSVDDRLSRFLPDFPNADRMTIRQLLTHTSGLHSYTNDRGYLDYAILDRSSQDMIDHIAHLQPKLDFEPGAASAYSNSGYYVLGVIVEKASGQSYKDYLQSRILKPLGLADTDVDAARDVVLGRVSGYEPAGSSPPRYRNPLFQSQSVAGAAGAMRSTVGDLVKWQHALLSGGVLKPESLKAMTTAATLADGRPTSANVLLPPGAPKRPPAEYGFGLRLGETAGEPSIGHGGAIQGFNGYVVTFPKRGVTLAILANALGAADPVQEQVARVLLAPPPK